VAETISYGKGKEGPVDGDTYPLAVVVEEGLELDDVWVPDYAHDLQFAILHGVSDMRNRSTAVT